MEKKKRNRKEEERTNQTKGKTYENTYNTQHAELDAKSILFKFRIPEKRQDNGKKSKEKETKENDIQMKVKHRTGSQSLILYSVLV